jgi:hypothetical protein
VFYSQDDRYLVERDLTVAHYEVDTAVLDPALQAAEPPGGPAGAPEAPASSGHVAADGEQHPGHGEGAP